LNVVPDRDVRKVVDSSVYEDKRGHRSHQKHKTAMLAEGTCTCKHHYTDANPCQRHHNQFNHSRRVHPAMFFVF